jgi:hypothetical protein
LDDGLRWQTLRRNLPPVPVHDLAIADGDLVAATHGRSFWILDDMSPLRELAPATTESETHLFTPRRAYRASFRGGADNGARHNAGPPRAGNPPSGAVIYYWLRSPHQSITLDFLDRQGKVIRRFSSQTDTMPSDAAVDLERPREPRVPNRAGLNMFAWDLRYPPPVSFRGMVLWAGHPAGARVLPGTYTVRLTAGTRTETRPVVVTNDPRSRATRAELVAQYELLTRINDTLSAANDAVRIIRNVKGQLATRAAHAAPGHIDQVRAATEPLVVTLSRIEETIYQVRSRSSQDPLNYPIRINDKLAALSGYVDNGSGRPTKQDHAVFQELASQLTVQLRTLSEALRALERVNQVLRAAGLQAITPRPTDELPGSRPLDGDSHHST